MRDSACSPCPGGISTCKGGRRERSGHPRCLLQTVVWPRCHQTLPALTSTLMMAQTSTPQVGTSGTSPKPQCQPHWLPGPLVPVELPRQSHSEQKLLATSLTGTPGASLLAPCSPLIPSSCFSSTSCPSLEHGQIWMVSGSPGSSKPTPMPLQDPKAKGLSAPQPLWALPPYPSLFPASTPQSQHRCVHPRDMQGVGAGTAKDAGKFWGVQSFPKPYSQHLHFPQPSLPTPISCT